MLFICRAHHSHSLGSTRGGRIRTIGRDFLEPKPHQLLHPLARPLADFPAVYCVSTARPIRNSRRTSKTRRDTTRVPAAVSPMSSRPARPRASITQKVGRRLPGLCFRKNPEVLTRALVISNPVGCSSLSSALLTGVVTSTAGYARIRSSPSQVSKTHVTAPGGESAAGDPDASGSTLKKATALSSAG
jgi:hypothetical protein